MKTKLMSVITVAIGLALFGADTASSQQYLDAEGLAQAFLLHDVAYYGGQVDAINEDSGSGVSIRFLMNAGLGITNLAINGTNIPLPKPLQGIPVPTNGYRGFNLNFWGMNADGGEASYGYMYTNALLRGDPIVVIVEPDVPPLFVPFNTSDRDADIVFDAGGYGYYDAIRRGFIVWLYSGTMSADYTIRSGDGVTLGWGTVRQFGSHQPAQGASAVTIREAGNIRDVSLTNNWRYLGNQAFDCLVTRGETTELAKVYGVRNIGRQKLGLWFYGLGNGTVEIRRWNPTGEMVPVPATITRDGEATSVVTGEYLDKAVVTILPDPAGQKPFEIQLFRTAY